MSRAFILLASATFSATLLSATLVPTAVRPAVGRYADHNPSLVEGRWLATAHVATSVL